MLNPLIKKNTKNCARYPEKSEGKPQPNQERHTLIHSKLVVIPAGNMAIEHPPFRSMIFPANLHLVHFFFQLAMFEYHLASYAFHCISRFPH